MKLIAPSYYTAFHCIADRCRHSCCIGWEIDIDDDTAAFYRSVGGALGDRLSKDVQTSKVGQASFRLTEDERCPFLNKNGLCDIIKTLGKGALCQICSDHPRFRNTFSDRTEIGLGLCCEAAAELILRQPDKTGFAALSDNDDTVIMTDEERRFFEQRNTLIAAAQDRSMTIEERQQTILALVGKTRPPLGLQQFCAIFLPLERLDEAWTAVLQSAQDAVILNNCNGIPESAFEQLLVYFLYRHLPGALEDDRLPERTAFAVHAVRFLSMLCAANSSTLDTLIELCRLFSAEIEYSDENLDALFEVF